MRDQKFMKRIFNLYLGFFKMMFILLIYHSVGGKTVYSFCVKVLNKYFFLNRIDTAWRKYLEVKDEMPE